MNDMVKYKQDSTQINDIREVKLWVWFITGSYQWISWKYRGTTVYSAKILLRRKVPLKKCWCCYGFCFCFCCYVVVAVLLQFNFPASLAQSITSFNAHPTFKYLHSNTKGANPQRLWAEERRRRQREREEKIKKKREESKQWTFVCESYWTLLSFISIVYSSVHECIRKCSHVISIMHACFELCPGLPVWPFSSFPAHACLLA